MRAQPRAQILSADAARDFGRSLRFIRLSHDRSLADVATAMGQSYQYIHNIEKGLRRSVSPEILAALSRGYAIDEDAVRCLWFRARTYTGLEEFGLDVAERRQVWQGIQALCAAIGKPCPDNVAVQAAIGALAAG